jgi:glycosyltransferase involved in cell wall biosynthesis
VSKPAHVLFLDPYHTASHRALSIALRDRSRHKVTLLTLPPRKWKWRMRGAALAFEPAVRALPRPLPDLLVTTDFLNLPEFLALTRDLWRAPLPAIVYFHENQLTYPATSTDVRDLHFGLVNVFSALAADRVLFNSDFHRESFLEAAETLVGQMPDFRPEGLAARIRGRSRVLGLPLDLAEMDAVPRGRREPWILWNHRWEEDRDPEVFFEAMRELDRLALRGEAPDFRLAVAGQTYRTRPAAFEAARSSLSHRIERWGFVESRRDYLDLIARCAVAVSTSRHEFFGVSVMEAIRLGCLPLLPRRLTYPAIVGGDDGFLYDDPAEIAGKAAALLRQAASPHGDASERLRAIAERLREHEATRVVGAWDDLIEGIAG